MLGSIMASSVTTAPSGAGEDEGVWVLVLLLLIVALIVALLVWRRRARRAGHPGLLVYLRSTPRTDAERRAALDMTLRGCVICLLAAIIPPLLIIGVFPLYYGARKLCMARMGLEILGEHEPAPSESYGGPTSSAPTG